MDVTGTSSDERPGSAFGISPFFGHSGAALVLTSLILLAGGCIWMVRGVDVERVEPDRGDRLAPVRIVSPVKAHLWDGSIVLFPAGAIYDRTALTGDGQRFSPTLKDTTRVSAVPLDSIAALETYKNTIRASESVALSLVATPVGLLGAAGLAVMIFGSCPTVYSAVGDHLELEAESFSNSIAPLLETRDVDPLRARVDAFGRVELEIRNEALETHYINHLELIEVRHDTDEIAVPGERGKALILRNLQTPTTIVDRAGRDVRPILAEVDGQAYQTDERILETGTSDDVMDYIDLVLPAPATDSVALVLRARNSLLNTVLFYEFMLAAQGVKALDWVGRELETIRSAVALGEFAARRMGLRVLVWEEGAFRQVARIGDGGPIAWEDLGVPIAVPEGDSLRIRLTFIADAWRIDRAAIAAQVRSGASRRIPPEQLLGAERLPHAEAGQKVEQPDDQYLITGPGDRFWVRFDAGADPLEEGRTFFLAAQGYYIEWIRSDWIRDTTAPAPFVASDETLHAALRKWQVVRSSYEERFEKTRVPVR